MSASVDAAQAVTDAINAGSYTRQFTAVRGYVPEFVLEDTTPNGLQVFVAPATHAVNNLTRGTKLHQPGIVVSVIEKPVDLSNEAIDPLVDLVEAIKVSLSGTINVGGQRMLGTIPEEPLYRPDVLTQQRVFWGMFTVTFRLPIDT